MTNIVSDASKSTKTPVKKLRTLSERDLEHAWHSTVSEKFYPSGVKILPVSPKPVKEKCRILLMRALGLRRVDLLSCR